MKLENFYYLVSGQTSAPWMIFLHGLLGSSRNWLKIIPEFQPDYSILNLDQRGHGKSFRPETGYGPQDFAHDLKFIMDELKISKAILVGHSMGARNALAFTHLYPERVDKLVMEDIGPEKTYENGQELIDKLKKVPVPFSSKRLAKEYLLNDFGDPKLGDFLYTHIKEEGSAAVWDFPLSMMEEIINKGRNTDMWSQIKSLKCPTLSIRGEKSREYTRPEFEKVLKTNSVISGVEIPGASHWVHFEKPKEFITALKNFF